MTAQADFIAARIRRGYIEARAEVIAARYDKPHMYMWMGKWWWMSAPQEHGQQYRSRVQLLKWFAVGR